MSTPLEQLIEKGVWPPTSFREWINEMMVDHAAAKKVHAQALDALLARGWCHSYHFTDSFIVRLSDLAHAGKESELDDVMAEFTRRQLDRILVTACEKYPARAAILADALQAHRAGQYTLSVPVFLSQLDGIGCEVMGLGRYFFDERKRASALSALRSNFKRPGGDEPYHLGNTHDRMLVALERKWPMASDTNARGAAGEYHPLNRNGVLHGLDTDYASEFNSLRSVLLLGFVLDVRQVLHDDIPAHLRTMTEALERSQV